MKKALTIFLALMLLLSYATAAYADEVSTPAEEPVIEEYLDLRTISKSLTISGTTATCSGAATSRYSSDSIHMTMYLQKRGDNNQWSSVVSWSATGTSKVLLNKTKSGLSGGTYRVRVYVSVYDANGTFVESANVYTSAKTVS